MLAASAVTSPFVFRHCARLVEASLGDVAARHRRTPALALVDLFVAGREALALRELAAVVWELIRRFDPALDGVVERLSAELEIVATRRAATVNVQDLGLVANAGV
jgi:hypothetical protein